ncbi:uncharacterized protein B0I36DRAFT_320723 [Microdochium trichocladiopsis]|uniref:SMODS and SLOG-associating 2TM effector domain-containing protein n=1 Tax=Microdochium trichocladiopsis TaxID=1682393 RepID=A0A9P8Y6L4_9PEZI|nr:uncharacterized protein B0I36DRAFT_320723 [Microdochium trichocladiopsis]KAH7033075.1 hypothetical protein B0I36DRAFT_320723 [Microdochium trichocladiopsis]
MTMASFLKAVLRLILEAKPQPAKAGIDGEQGITGVADEKRPAPSHSLWPSNYESQQTVPTQPSHLIPENDSLLLYRLMMGISAAPHLGFDLEANGGRRPAANLGIYARVVHAEQKAKDSFKVFSVIINGCYFLQIIVAAALTAMGAANANNKAITAFGAFNTIIAGLLTFLKGSGLPARYKYYGNEWKKIRQYIEQRERDFSRQGCTLDVYHVAETIEKMYAHIEQEIEANTPDSYTSVTRSSQQLGINNADKIGGMDVSKLEGFASKLSGLDSTIAKITAGLKDKTQGLTQGLHEREKEVEAEVRRVEESVEKHVQEHKDKLAREAQLRRNEVESVRETASAAVADRFADVTRSAGAQVSQIENLAHGLADRAKQVETVASHGRVAGAQLADDLARAVAGTPRADEARQKSAEPSHSARD